MRPLQFTFIGNQNNYPFILARALRGAGHEVRVIVDQSDRLDRPEYRYTDIAYPYPSWIHECEPVRLVDVAYHTERWRRVLSLASDSDALVLNRWAFDAAARLPVPALCLTTGADVDYWSRASAAAQHAEHMVSHARGSQWIARAFDLNASDRESWLQYLDHVPEPLYRAWHEHVFRTFARRQRAGLRRAVAISAFPDDVSPPLAAIMRECLQPDTARLWLMMADCVWIQPQPLPHNRVLRIFNAARLLWKHPFPVGVGEWENKGTDILLRGVALWHRRTGGVVDLRFVEKGPSVHATKDLVRELGLTAMVSWQPEMTQAEVFDEYRFADVVSEQCGSHVLGMAGYEAMAAGRPVLANGRPELCAPLLGGPPPVAQARTPEEIAEQIAQLHNVDYRRRLATAGRRFVAEQLSPARAATAVADLFAAHRLLSQPRDAH